MANTTISASRSTRDKLRIMAKAHKRSQISELEIVVDRVFLEFRDQLKKQASGQGKSS